MKRCLEVILLAFWAATVHGQQTTQTFTLRPGWNAIWVELDPTNRTMEAVFSNLPIVSVWSYFPEGGSVEFIQESTEAQFNKPGWRRWLPAVQPGGFLTTLFTVNAQRAYLVRMVSNAPPVTLTITGVPVIKPPEWQANSFNFLGFPTDPDNPPTFGSFFSSASAHAGQRIYRLATNGFWSLAAASDRMRYGEAYWVYSLGQSSFQAPLGLDLSGSRELDYGTTLDRLGFVLQNPSSNGTLNVSIQDIITGANTPLSYQSIGGNQVGWANLPAPYQTALAPQALLNFPVLIRRKDFATNVYASILEIKDNAGTRYRLAVTAEKLGAARPGLAAAAPQGLAANLAGLWAGTVSVTNVNEAHSADPSVPTPTRSAFDLRLLLHVTTNAEARLLKEVIQMWQPTSYTNDNLGNRVQQYPGRYVLLTDDSRLPDFQGSSPRASAAVGRRLSSIDFDFDGGPNNYLTLTGSFGIGQTARCTIVVEPNFPTNPYKHKYHPDHDNLDENFAPLAAGTEEAFRITRQIEMIFSATDPAGTNATDAVEYGYSILGGSYREVITGLDRTNLITSGSFRLARVSNTPVLNQ